MLVYINSRNTSVELFLLIEQLSCVTISYALILVFLAKKRIMKQTQKRKEQKTNTTKDFKILMYVTMYVVRLCNILKKRHQ